MNAMKINFNIEWNIGGEIAAWNAPARDESVSEEQGRKEERETQSESEEWLVVEGRATICREAGKMHWAQLSV